MVFVSTFAVGGGSGKVVPMPNWALVIVSAPISSLWISEFFKFL
jgi:hypothetical protein